MTRDDLIAAGIVADPSGTFAQLQNSVLVQTDLAHVGERIVPEGPPFPSGTGLSRSCENALPAVDGKMDPSAAGGAPIFEKMPCSECGSLAYTKSRIRRGQIYCLSCARSAR